MGRLFHHRPAKVPQTPQSQRRTTTASGPHASTYLEITVAAIEAALLVGLALPIWAKTTDQFPKSTKPGDVTTIKVIAQQFIWNGLYPGTNGVFARQDREFVNSQNPFGYDTNDVNYKSNFSVKGELYVPVGKPVIVQISSLDVIHCFSCKPMRTVQDAIPGMMIPVVHPRQGRCSTESTARSFAAPAITR